MKYKVIIFDLDGVIVDTEPLHYKAYKQALCNYGIDLSLETYNQKLRSRGRYIGLVSIMGEIPKEKIEQIGNEKDLNFLSMIKKKPMIYYQDAIDLIKYCKMDGIGIAIATASHKGRALLDTYEMHGWFDRVVTAQDVKHNKPNPEIYDTCKSHFNLSDDEILVIEDSEAGIKAAIASNLHVAYIRRKNAPAISDEIIKSDKVKTYDNLDSLLAELRSS